MITNISYNVLIERFRAFAEGHYLIKGFTHGDPSNVDLLKGVEFPWMHVFPVEVAPQAGSRLYSFIITFADLPRDKETPPEYQREMLSDCIRLAEDLLAEIQNGLTLFGPTVELDGGASIECFINEFSHTLTGVNLSLTLSVPWNWSACDIPADWSVGGSGSGGTGSGGLGVILETNGVVNGNQSLLNLQQGTNVTIVDNGNGTVTINSIGDGTGTVTSVALTMPSGFVVSGSPITTNGTLAITGAGTSSDYIDGTGAVQPFPTITPQVNADWNSVSGVSEILNKPTIPAAQVNSDWNASSGVAQILNKPTIGSGSVTSVAIQLPTPANAAYSVSGSPVTTSGTFTVVANGTILQYIDGTGALRTFPNIPKTLADLIPGTQKGDLLEWDGTKWAILPGMNLDRLTDVTLVGPTNGQVLQYNGTAWVNITPASGGSVTSVGLTMPAAFNVTGSPVTTAGTLAVSGAGTSAQYVDGTGALQTMPTGLPPTGSAGGDLTGTYPNPTVHRIHGIDMQSGTPSVGDVWLYEGSPAKWQHQQLPAVHVGNDSAVTGSTVKDALNHLGTTKVETTRSISTSSPLSGGGDLSANRTLSIADAVADGSTKGAAAFTAADFNSSSGVISIDYTNGQKATAAQPGFLTAADWSTFNSKVGTDSIAYASNPNISQAANSTAYWAITGGAAPNATENARVIVMPCAGTLKNLYIRIGALQASGGTMVFTLRKNAADTAITVTFANADGSNVTKSDTTNSVTVAAGDTIAIKGVNNAPSSASGTFVSFSILLERS